jgi:hypothetical protein
VTLLLGFPQTCLRPLLSPTNRKSANLARTTDRGWTLGDRKSSTSPIPNISCTIDNQAVLNLVADRFLEDSSKRF